MTTSQPSPEIWTRSYDVSTFLVSRQGRLSLYGLLNCLQDASIVHAFHLGHGLRATLDREALWVLTRQKIRMKRWPAWNSEISITTWVRPSDGAFAVRDFFVFEGDEKIGEATTSWLLLHSKTHKPIRENISALGFPTSSSHHCSFNAEKIPVVHEGLSKLASFEVRNSDIDSNQHVNNTRYSQWVLDAIPIAQHAAHVLDAYAVNFLAETHLGDLVEIYGDGQGYFHGLRPTDQKVVFTARLDSHASR